MPKQILILLFMLAVKPMFAQNPCSNIGQTPGSAFPVCGTSTFVQNTVPACGSINVPCPCTNATFLDLNPYWYKFTCFTAGSLGFVITPNNLNDDYDWQIFDLTGHTNPNDVFTDPSMFVCCNWSGEVGKTGASASGTGSVNCAGSGVPLFNTMPNLIAGHEYLLLVSHFTAGSQSGYSLTFNGGTAVITDPLSPAISSARISCDGTKVYVKLNKQMKCTSLAANGSDFTISGGGNVISAASPSCGSGFDMDSLILTLGTPLTPGNYTLTIGNGSDGNTLLDNCATPVPVGDNVQFAVAPTLPTPMDSLTKPGCAAAQLQLVFSRPINCTSIAANGSDFIVQGPQPITVSGIAADPGCAATGFTNTITVQLSSPIVVGGNYFIRLVTGTDGNTIFDECGRQTPAGSTINFTMGDTVSADFAYTMLPGCKNDTLTFSHDGRNGVNNWAWTLDNATTDAQTVTEIYSASSQHTIKLVVSNGFCRDSTTQTVVLDNKVIAAFETDNIICPEDSAKMINQTKGVVDGWLWTFGDNTSSPLKDPLPHQYPIPGRELTYTITLYASNTALRCRDSVSHSIKVLGNCYIAVPSAFTPNGDGLNDYLYPLNALKAENLDFKVYNRWGQQVFATKNWLEKWDGTINGRPQGTGVYVWYLRFINKDTKKEVFMKGTTVLIR